MQDQPINHRDDRIPPIHAFLCAVLSPFPLLPNFDCKRRFAKTNSNHWTQSLPQRSDIVYLLPALFVTDVVLNFEEMLQKAVFM